MLSLAARIFGDGTSELQGKIAGIFAVVGALNVAAWAAAAILFHGHPLLFGTAFLAYSFGLRHAVDADHIAAIDNVTRKLIQEGKRPVAVGFFFSLGHSSVVIGLSLVLAVTAASMRGRLGVLENFGGVFGVAISCVFLFVLAAMNLFVLRGVLRVFRRVKNGGRYEEDDLNLMLARRGLVGRLFAGLFRLVDRSWYMYPIGVLFGLGFDTATEVGLLGISATEATNGLGIWAIMVFPALFTAGMALIDTADTVLMLGAYTWSFVKPLRKLYYNITITALSVAVALVVGAIEMLCLLEGRWKPSGRFWHAIAVVSGHYSLVGYAIIGVSAACWAVSMLIYKLRRYDDIVVETGE